MREPNIPLLRKAVEWVEEQEQLDPRTRQWMQETVVLPEDARIIQHHHEVGCGTAYCVAGYVAHLVDPDHLRGNQIEVAAEALGIDWDDRSTVQPYVPHGGLFSYDNKAADIRSIAEQLAGEKL